MSTHTEVDRTFHRLETMPQITFYVGALALMAFASFPWVGLVLGLVAIAAAVAGRKSATDAVHGAMLCIGGTFAITAIVLSWMTPGIFSIVWGN